MTHKLFIVNRFIIIAILFSSLYSVRVMGQDVYNQPLPPNLDFVTVNPNTGHPTLYWTAPRAHPVRPAPTGYIIYRRLVDALGNTRKEAIDTLAPNVFSYTDTKVDAGVKPESYTIASNGASEPSTQTTEHKTAFVTARYDTCQNQIIVDWMHYEGWGNRIKSYNVFLGTESNAELLPLDTTVLGLVSSVSIDIKTNQTYYLYVEATKNDSIKFLSKSNLTSISTNVARPPNFMYIDSILATTEQTEIYFTIDPATEYTDFRITRWEQPDSIRSIFSARTLHRFSDPNTTFFADTTDLWTVRSRKFYYKIDAYDGCEHLNKKSNLCNSMFIRAYAKETNANLSWDKYLPDTKELHSNNVQYKIYRIAFAPNPLESELIFNELSPVDTTSIDDLSIYWGKNYNPKFCYFLEAYEMLGANVKDRLSRSQTVCVDVIPDLVMPNAIDPMSNFVYDGKPRNIFAPTVSFIADYKLIIYSRWGGIVYEGVNEGWDGRLPNGEYAKEGTYIYRIEVHPPSKRTISRTGYLSVVYGPSQL